MTQSPVMVDDVITSVQSKIKGLKFDLACVWAPGEDEHANCLREISEQEIILSALQEKKERESPDHYLQVRIKVGNSWAQVTRDKAYIPHNKDGIPGHLKEMLIEAQRSISMTDLYPPSPAGDV